MFDLSKFAKPKIVNKIVDIPCISTNKTDKSHAITYDKTTTETYRVLRKRGIDPITHETVHIPFKFNNKWDPYTGERLEVDPDGPLCFDPDILIKHFYTNRLNKLYVNMSDEQDGTFSEYYDDGVGGGDDFNIIGRGHHPEWYLFRLPIVDCYLTIDHNHQHITMGPRLTDQEITHIDELAASQKDNYKKMYGVQRPSLQTIKKYYDIAISKDHNYKINCDAVITLKNIIG